MSTEGSVAERLRRNPLIRHAPVTALGILIAVCLTGLGLIRHDWLAIPAVAPVGAAVAVYFLARRR